MGAATRARRHRQADHVFVSFKAHPLQALIVTLRLLQDVLAGREDQSLVLRPDHGAHEHVEPRVLVLVQLVRDSGLPEKVVVVEDLLDRRIGVPHRVRLGDVGRNHDGLKTGGCVLKEEHLSEGCLPDSRATGDHAHMVFVQGVLGRRVRRVSDVPDRVPLDVLQHVLGVPIDLAV